jgi:hypothetical protein
VKHGVAPQYEAQNVLTPEQLEKLRGQYPSALQGGFPTYTMPAPDAAAPTTSTAPAGGTP